MTQRWAADVPKHGNDGNTNDYPCARKKRLFVPAHEPDAGYLTGDKANNDAALSR